MYSPQDSHRDAAAEAMGYTHSPGAALDSGNISAPVIAAVGIIADFPHGVINQYYVRRSTLLPPIITALEALGLTVQEPLAFDNRSDPLTPNWMYQCSQRAFAGVAKAGAVFAMVDDTPPDQAVMVQLGMAIAMRKPTFLFRDDVRRATENGDYPLNLMLFTGMLPEGWRDHYYTTLDEITAPQKALARWARQ